MQYRCDADSSMAEKPPVSLRTLAKNAAASRRLMAGSSLLQNDPKTPGFIAMAHAMCDRISTAAASPDLPLYARPQSLKKACTWSVVTVASNPVLPSGVHAVVGGGAGVGGAGGGAGDGLIGGASGS